MSIEEYEVYWRCYVRERFAEHGKGACPPPGKSVVCVDALEVNHIKTSRMHQTLITWHLPWLPPSPLIVILN